MSKLKKCYDLIRSRKLYYRKDIWSIGIFESRDLINIYENKAVKNPVLTKSDINDVKAKFLADPFIIKGKDSWYMLFEVYDEIKNKGVIGAASSVDGYNWSYDKVVLEEKFHLSYPYVFKYNSEYYMIPECGESNFIKIYKSSNFPYDWSLIGNIIEGTYWDPSIFRYEDKWWMLAASSESNSYSLHLFYSENLAFGWESHPGNPLIKNSLGFARPGGRVVVCENKLIRYSQDCTDYYGRLVRAFEINKISTSEYEETYKGVAIKDSQIKKSWNKDGMHTICMEKLNNDKWIAAVDGQYLKKYNVILSKIKSFVMKFYYKYSGFYNN